MSHAHIHVFHGVKKDFDPGLVVHRTTTGWDVVDATRGKDATLGTFASEIDACRHALRILRERLSEPVVPCWGGGADASLTALGYDRGRLRWRWWPPGFIRVGESTVGTDGLPFPKAAVQSGS